MIGRFGIALVTALTLGTAVSAPMPASAQTATVPLIEPATLHAYMQGGIKVTIVDVRQPEEFAQGAIKGATLIPLGTLEANLSKLPKKGKLIVYCRSGRRSAQAVEILMQHGYKDVASLDGGYTAWSAKGY